MVKNAAKKTKKNKKASRIAAIISCRQEKNRSLLMLDGDSNEDSNSPPKTSSNTLPNGSVDELHPEKQKRTPRGKAKCLAVSKQAKHAPLPLDFNHRGQPIKENAAKFSSFLGMTARELLPVNMTKWKDVSIDFKDQIWEHVTQNFVVDECHKDYTFRKLLKIWREWRSSLVKQVRAQAEVVGLPRAAALLKPENIESMDKWMSFIKARTSPKFLEKTEKFKEMRAKQVDLVHRTSRKSFAVVEDELKQKSTTPDAISRADVWIHAYEARKKNSEGEVQDSEIVQQVKQYKAEEDPSQKNSIKNDAVAKVLGPDPRGRVRGFGFGANPSKVDGQIHMGNEVTRLENELESLKGLVKDLFVRLDKGGNNFENTSAQHSANEIARKKRKENPNDQNSCNDERTQNDQGKQKGNKSIQNSASERAQNKKSKKASAASIHDFGSEGAQRKQKEIASFAEGANLENKMCKLLSWFKKDEVVVATAEISSTDPSALVHHVPLGHDCWKVWVRDVIDNIALYRATTEFGKLASAEQSTIAWPIKYIKLD